jgi:uncharacterized protein with GYD domain
MKTFMAFLCGFSLYFLFGFQQEDLTRQLPASNNQMKFEPSAASPNGAVQTTSYFYITRFSYTPETWARLMKNPEDRRVAARKYIESVGGKLHGFWYAFGAYDGYCIWQAPDNISMAAVGLAITGGGALSKFETTPLLTVEETLDALRRSQTVGYRPPGK